MGFQSRKETLSEDMLFERKMPFQRNKQLIEAVKHFGSVTSQTEEINSHIEVFYQLSMVVIDF